MNISHFRNYTRRGSKQFYCMWVNDSWVKVSYQNGIMQILYASRDLHEDEIYHVRKHIASNIGG
jgi:hypothetical protein